MANILPDRRGKGKPSTMESVALQAYMRVSTVLLVLCCLIPLSSSAQDPDRREPASIEGLVLNAVTGEPVRKAHLRLILAPPGKESGSGDAPRGAGAVSDGEGKFKFENLEPGRYSLFAEKAGFVRQPYAARSHVGEGAPLTIKAGEKIGDMEFKLMPQAVISGKVVDEEGEPLSQASVHALRRISGSWRAVVAMTADTNDDGEFRISNLIPGKYIIRGEYRSGMFRNGVEDYVPTFHPGSVDPDAAMPIELQAGQKFSGVEIRLQKARVYRLRGKVVGIAPDEWSRLRVFLEPQKPTGERFVVFDGGSDLTPDGAFELSSVHPGSYFLTAYGSRIGRMPITVSNGDIDGIIIETGAPLPISGRVEVEDHPAAKIQGNVVLQPSDGLGLGIAPAPIQNDGAFEFEGVNRAKYHVTVMDLPEGMYVKRVKAGDSDVFESGLDLSRLGSVPRLEIVVSGKAATIEGVVRHEGEPWPGASIILAPEPLQPERLRWLVKTASSDQNGRFTLTSVAPGEYRLFAWEESLPGFELDLEQLKACQPQSVRITLGDEARKRVQLDLARPHFQ